VEKSEKSYRHWVFRWFFIIGIVGLSVLNTWIPLHGAPSESPSPSESIVAPSEYNPATLVEQLTDPTNILSDNKPKVLEAINQVLADSKERLYVVFLPRFDGATTPDEWAAKTAELSGFTSNCVLYAVAYESGHLAIYIPKDSKNLSFDKISNIADAAQPFLENAAWSDSVKAAAASIINQTVIQTENYLIVFSIIGVGILGLIGYLLWFFVFRSSAKAKRQAKRKAKVRPLGEVEELHQNLESIDPNVSSTNLAAEKISSWISNHRTKSAKSKGNRRRVR
jgi:hypothetical protein